jgi:hypothetical protein
MRYWLICIIAALVLHLNLVHGFLTSTEQEKEFEVIPNPHSSDKNNVCFSNNLDGFLEPYYLLTKPLPTQPDTFQDLSYAKVMTVPVPLYRMKQPARVSHNELEFQLVLVRELSSTGKSNIHAVTVELELAKDSWFPGYYWSPLVMACPETNDLQHVGWKFTALVEDSQNNDLPHFYALMVRIDDREKKGVQISIGGVRAPGWMAAQILS